MLSFVDWQKRLNKNSPVVRKLEFDDRFPCCAKKYCQRNHAGCFATKCLWRPGCPPAAVCDHYMIKSMCVTSIRPRSQTFVVVHGSSMLYWGLNWCTFFYVSIIPFLCVLITFRKTKCMWFITQTAPFNLHAVIILCRQRATEPLSGLWFTSWTSKKKKYLENGGFYRSTCSSCLWFTSG